MTFTSTPQRIILPGNHQHIKALGLSRLSQNFAQTATRQVNGLMGAMKSPITELTTPVSAAADVTTAQPPAPENKLRQECVCVCFHPYNQLESLDVTDLRADLE